MLLLHIDSSVLGANSASRALSAEIVERQRALHPGLSVIHRDLAADSALHLSRRTWQLGKAARWTTICWARTSRRAVAIWKIDGGRYRGHRRAHVQLLDSESAESLDRSGRHRRKNLSLRTERCRRAALE